MKRWTLSYDGAGEPTSSEAMSSGYHGSGAYLPMQFSVQCNAVSPVWDLGAAVSGGEPVDVGSDAVWMGRHQEQGFTTTGQLTVNGQTWDINGIAYRDHSWGARDMSDFSGDAFMCLVFPESGGVVQGLQTWNAAGELSLRTFYISEGGEMELMSEGFTPRADDLLGNPNDLTMKLRRAGGEEIVIHGRALHNAVICMTNPNVQCNGVPPDTSQSLLLNESPITFTWPDGEVGYGHTERGLRLP
jgi:hypothetical protein